MWPSRSLRPLVDVLVVLLVPLLVAASARVPAEERPSFASRALPLWSLQSRLRTPFLGILCVTSLHTCHFAPFGHQKWVETDAAEQR